MNKRFLLPICWMFILGAMPAFANSQADTMYVNGRIYQTICINVRADGAPRQIEKCEGHTYVQAMAVKDGKILAIGSAQAVLKSKGAKTEEIDLKGRFVMPGFNDAHIHLASGGFEKLNVDLVGVKSLGEMKERIAARVKTAGPGEWIRGRGWDHTKWQEQVLPNRQELDLVTGDHPAIFTRVDGHIAVANSAALKTARIAKDTPDPEGGKIDRD